jgi:hypothetical protein
MICPSFIIPLYVVSDVVLHLDKSGYFVIFQLD